MFSIKKKAKLTKVLDILLAQPIWKKSEEGRMRMTISCRDCDYIPKSKDAGKVVEVKGEKLQIMHNGMKVVAGGYYGGWMSEIIRSLKGHHEPQEEKLFYEITKRLDDSPTIMELGSFWSYYSLWVTSMFPKARAICCEPDPGNMKIGQRNAKLNNTEKQMKFVAAAAGSKDKDSIRFNMDSSPGSSMDVEVRSVDSLFKENKLSRIDILHMDVQGVELDALKGALESIRGGKVRFLFVSTHHYMFSGDPMTHQKCKAFIAENGGQIIAAHNVLESFSGDGLIVASFDERDKDFRVDVSINESDDSLFRCYEEDIAALLNYIEDNK